MGDPLWQVVGAITIAFITAIVAPSILRRFKREDDQEQRVENELLQYRTERAEEYRRLRGEYQVLDDRHAALREECSALRLKNTGFQQQIEILNKTLETIKATVMELTQENTRLAREVEMLKSENYNLYRQVNEMRGRPT